MIGFFTLIAFAVAACAFIALRAWCDHKAALAQRRGLLDEAALLFDDPRITIAPDRFPVLAASLEDGAKVRLEIISDSLVTRRLPQLWLRLVLSERRGRPRPTIGALARPTGAEYYSLVHDMPHWLEPPDVGVPLLVRGDGSAGASQVARLSGLFRTFFSDPTLKEAVITPRATSVIRQVAQGDRGAHVLLRQAHFKLSAVPAELVHQALSEARALSAALAQDPLQAEPSYEAA
ncbi:hypothetical protein [Mesorhizobium sp. SP-1A]|uniref:hypothetical protein n=1 Tax=Mesorhizobium sp. SP-1A TaxID=3077840 RepID=UPI0028F70739|nr:hypothetical protein [Mesorhizobium sp. SP-1A]